MMTEKSINRYSLIYFIALSLVFIGMVKPVYSQSPAADTAFHPYHVNYWVTGGILIGGVSAELIGLPWITNKRSLTNAELQGLEKNDLNTFDHWALNFNVDPTRDPSVMGYYSKISDNVLTASTLLPFLTLLDGDMRPDWLDILLMYSETVIITANVYLYSPFGPIFQNRYRPVVYYDMLTNDERMKGTNRNSLYSGHTAETAAASFFTAKVYCDYHPELGWNKYLVYAAAAIPPLAVGYLRLRALQHFPSDILLGFGVGALCGILVPEMHRVSIENTSLGLYSSPLGTGITLKWQPRVRN